MSVCLTINTDASYCSETNASGYAFYIVCDLFKIQKGGNFKALVSNSKDAELKSIGNAIYTVINQKELPEVKHIIINSDCVPALTDIKNRSTITGKRINNLIKKLQKLLKAKNIHYRHVKAHSGKNDSRSWVNEWCDKEAKKWMKKERNKVKQI